MGSLGMVLCVLSIKYTALFIVHYIQYNTEMLLYGSVQYVYAYTVPVI